MDSTIVSMGSMDAATVDAEACSRAMSMIRSKTCWSRRRSALLKSPSSMVILSSSILKLGTVLPIYTTAVYALSCIWPGGMGINSSTLFSSIILSSLRRCTTLMTLPAHSSTSLAPHQVPP